MKATKLATLFAHDDGRHAVWPGVESPPWTHGDPCWHRVGPVDVDAIATPQCLAQIEEPAGAAPAAVAGSAPAGWRLVPAVPTREWIGAVADDGYWDCDCAQLIANILSHAPAAPALEAPAAPAVPAGFALVPIEPTQQMLDAGRWSGAGSVSIQEEWARKEVWSRMLATVTPPPAAYADDLVALVTELVQALRKATPDNDLAGHALDYLKRNGLQESPLRAADTAPQAPAAPSGVRYKQEPGSSNCMQCAMAFMLGLRINQVPDFAASGSPKQCWELFESFAEAQGYSAVMIPGNRSFEADYLVSGTSPRGTPHMVVMNDGRLVHDPHPSNAGLSDVQCVWLLARRAAAPQAPAAPWKDHKTARLVNDLRDCAIKYHGAGQLRERIAHIVVPLCDQLKAPMAAPAAPAVDASDTARMNWLEAQVVNVRAPLRYGSRDMFWASPEEVDGGPDGPSDLRARIDAAQAAAKGANES